MGMAQIKLLKSFREEFLHKSSNFQFEKVKQVKMIGNTYIMEDDFRFMSTNGLDAVSIPVGWWIAHGPRLSRPFVGGLASLAKCYHMGTVMMIFLSRTFGMKVIVDLHKVQGSQNGNEYSRPRDGYLGWAAENIQDTVAVIDFLTAKSCTFDEILTFLETNVYNISSFKYANHPSLIEIELMNEPLAQGMSGMILEDYVKCSKDGNPIDQWHKQIHLRKDLYTYKKRLLLIFEDDQNFAKAPQDVYGLAYWSYKCASHHWSLRWMIENNHIKL
ncbi:hypothetical protein FEM48_Zijuj08G0165800 [Ziziphus jujuba var. spinosa]|uniref:Mannan endo-1,4-beta-mannosidase n=1 Tax=Ziziphus jujuba var. spinosa TaxID=714518 RepID=A0A978V069_ZIZJJ|nr:hypothetical protein FEM48_Zijuj08G0165800 [Ziziphus jujuba var. spinosa]